LIGKIQRIGIGDAVSKDISVILDLDHVILVCQQRISVIFDYVRLLFYASFQDCMKIQSDLNKLSE
jgi:hypothetical protein